MIELLFLSNFHSPALVAEWNLCAVGGRGVGAPVEHATGQHPYPAMKTCKLTMLVAGRNGDSTRVAVRIAP